MQPWRRPAPDAIRRLDTLDDPDYTDVFTGAPIETGARSPEDWARAILEGAPAPLRAVVLTAWRGVLGFRLGPRPSPDHVFGWKISARGDDCVTIANASWLMTAHIVLKTEPGQIQVATLIRYEGWPARLIWPPLSILHRHVGMALMRHAQRPAR